MAYTEKYEGLLEFVRMCIDNAEKVDATAERSVISVSGSKKKIPGNRVIVKFDFILPSEMLNFDDTIFKK